MKNYRPTTKKCGNCLYALPFCIPHSSRKEAFCKYGLNENEIDKICEITRNDNERIDYLRKNYPHQFCDHGCVCDNWEWGHPWDELNAVCYVNDDEIKKFVREIILTER